MFGVILVNEKTLTPEQKARYRRYYCGLCRAIGRRFGGMRRLTLTYDMTFLALLLDALYEPGEEAVRLRCLPHPFKPHDAQKSVYIDYAADMNALLAYEKCRDDWQDEGDVVGRAGTAFLKNAAREAGERWPTQRESVREGLARLCAIEAAGDMSLDAAANCFGDLCAAVFVPKADPWEKTLRKMGGAMGRFIYLTDAFCDVDADARRGRYNPLIPLRAEPAFVNRCEELLTLHMGECAMAFETLPILRDAQILRNILYSGVWTRFAAACARRGKERAR